MNLLFCSWCGRKIPVWVYRNARYCGDFCRKAHYELRCGRFSVERRLQMLEDVGESSVVSVRVRDQ